jgi:hypothetical protein
MKRLSRHTVVVLLVALLSSVGGMTLAVVAFGQSGGDPDATVPAGDYTGTTPAPSTSPLSPYATTPATTPTTPAETTPNDAQTNTTGTTKPERTHGKTSVPSGTGNLPSRATRRGPTHLAFTGGEPLYVGFFGVALMAGGLMLHRRRRAASLR